jgi:hypothetical protein
MKAADPIDTVRLALLLAELRLPAIKQVWADFAVQADKEGWPTARFLAVLAEHEMAERSRRHIERHLAEAKLPPGKPSTPLTSRPSQCSARLRSWRDRPSVMAVRGLLEPPLLPSPQAVVAPQPGYPAATDPQAGTPQFLRHPGTAIGAVREGKGRPDMRQQHHAVMLVATGWPTSLVLQLSLEVRRRAVVALFPVTDLGEGLMQASPQ